MSQLELANVTRVKPFWRDWCPSKMQTRKLHREDVERRPPSARRGRGLSLNLTLSHPAPRTGERMFTATAAQSGAL